MSEGFQQIKLVQEMIAHNLSSYVDFTEMFIESDNKELCKYIINKIDINSVKDLLDDDGIDDFLYWKLEMIYEYEDSKYNKDKDDDDEKQTTSDNTDKESDAMEV